MRQALSAIIGAGLGVFVLILTSCAPETSAGPNGGDIVPLGSQVEAELVANAETGEVMVHTWDEDLKTARPIEAEPLTIGSGVNTLVLKPHPLPGDPSGLCSRFYGRADWVRGGAISDGWIRHGDMARHEFGWRNCWSAGRSHGQMWAEMGAHGGSGPGHRSGHGHGSAGG